MQWTDKPPTIDGWYFVRTVWIETGEPSRYISVEHINARKLAAREKQREQAVKRGQLTVYRTEQFAGPIPEPEEPDGIHL